MSQLLKTSDVEEQEGARQTAALIENMGLLTVTAAQQLFQEAEAEKEEKEPEADPTDLDQQRVAGAAAGMVQGDSSVSQETDAESQQRMAALVAELGNAGYSIDLSAEDVTADEEFSEEEEAESQQQIAALVAKLGKAGTSIELPPEVGQEAEADFHQRIAAAGARLGNEGSSIDLIPEGEREEVEDKSLNQILQELEELEQRLKQQKQGVQQQTDLPSASPSQDDPSSNAAEPVQDSVDPSNAAAPSQPSEDVLRVYQAEEYIVSRRGDSYTVWDAEEKAIFSFEATADRGFQISHDSMNEKQRQEFLTVASNLGNQNEVKGEALQQILSDASGHAQVNNLGGLAPEGSKALVVANQVLKEAGADQASTPKYQFDRQAGKVTIKDHEQKPLVVFDPKANQIHTNWSAEDRQNFNQNFSALQAQGSQQRSGAQNQSNGVQKEQER